MNKAMSVPHVPDIGVRQLAAVLAVAEYRSFIAAASSLQTSQPALTRTIKRVEDVLGVQLFERSTRHVSLTSAGLEFVAVAQRITNDLQISVKSMRELADQQRGQVIVTAIMSIANSRLPDIVTRYKAQHPGIELQIRDGVHGTVNEEVRNGVADFGINYLKDTSDTIATTRLGSEKFVVVAPSGHPIARNRSKSLPFAALEHQPLVSMPADSQTRRIIDATAVTRGVHLTHAIIVSQINTMMSYIRAGAGIGVVPSASAGGDEADGFVNLEIVDPAISLDVGIVKLHDRDLSPAAAGLLECVIDGWQAH